MLESRVHATTFYKWEARYGRLEVSEARRLEALEDENRRLKKLLNEAVLDAAALKLLAIALGMAAARDRMRLLTPLARIGRPTIVVVQALNRFFERMGCVLPSVGNSTLQFKKLDAFVLERMVRSIPRKHDARNWCRGSADLIESPTPLGVSRVTGTIRYVSVRAAW